MGSIRKKQIKDLWVAGGVVLTIICVVCFASFAIYTASQFSPNRPVRSPSSLVVPFESRSSQWPKVRAEHLEREPTCAVCGSTADLQVHHIFPFRKHPERELDPDNLITLCGPGGHNCHFSFGHFFNYQSWNEGVREDAKAWSVKVRNRPR